MKTESFCYWLQGYLEINNPQTIGKVETEMIKRHLNMVFKHDIDPKMGGPEHQAELNEIHHGVKKPLKYSTSVYSAAANGNGEIFNVSGLDTNTNSGDGNKLLYASNEAEAIALYGPKPSPKHEFSIHGWYHPDEGVPRC